MGTVSNRGTKERPMWYCRYIDIDGKRKQRPTKQTNKAAALRFVAEIEARVARGLIGIPEATAAEQLAKTITIGALAERFLQDYDPPRLKDRKIYMANLGPWVRQRLLGYPLASMPVVSVKRLHIEQYRDALRKKGFKPSTVNVSLGYLSRVFSWGIESELIDVRSPCIKIERLRTAPSEQQYTREQCAQLLGPDGDPMIATALLTGMRHGELRGLTWSCVRFELNALEVKRSFRTTPKSGKPRTIPLHSDLAPILRAWQARCPETAEELVFPVLANGRYRLGCKYDAIAVRRQLEVAGCPGDHLKPWHAMRHTFATLLAESGASMDAISRILGHSLGGYRITSGYVHSSLKYLSSEIEKLHLLPSAPASVLRIADYRPTA